jgi:hypothetical protein
MPGAPRDDVVIIAAPFGRLVPTDAPGAVWPQSGELAPQRREAPPVFCVGEQPEKISSRKDQFKEGEGQFKK